MNNIKKILLLILSLLLFLSACEELPIETVGSDKLCYKTVEGVELTLELLYPTNDQKRKSPAVIVLHGGGWVSGTPEDFTRDFEPLCNALREGGMTVIPVEYRLVSEDSTWRDALDDCEDALNYLIDNSRSLGLEPELFGIIGYSAGGQLALMTAIETRDLIKLCVSMSSPTLISDTEVSPYYSEPLNYYISRAFSKDNALEMYQASPIIRVNRNCKSDFLLISGMADEVVNSFHASSFYNEVSSFRLDAELLEFEGLTHSYTSYPEYQSLCETIAERVLSHLK